MKANQMVGIVVLVLGAVLLGFAYQSSNALLDQISSIVTGRYTDQTMWYLIGGIVLTLAGGLLIIFGKATIRSPPALARYEAGSTSTPSHSAAENTTRATARPVTAAADDGPAAADTDSQP